MANLACLELHPHPVRADDLDHPDELRVDLDPVPGVEWPQIREVAQVVRATLDDFGLVGWPKTSGSRGMHVYVRIEPRWTFDAGAPRRARARARGRAARAGARHEQVVEGRAPRRVPRLQPEREGPHGRRRLLGAADARRARLGAARLGRGRRLRSGRLHAARRCRRGSRRSAIGTPASIGMPCSLDALLELSARQEREGLGDAPWPPHYRKQPGERRRRVRSPSKPAGRAATHPLDRDRHARARKTTRSRASSAGRRAIRRRRAPGAGRRARRRDARPVQTWTRIRVNLQHVPESCGPPQEPLDPDERPERLADVTGRRPAGAEDLLELVRRRDLELIVAAVLPAACPAASAGRARRGGSDRPACGRTSPRRRARCAAAPTTDPCPRSSGSARPACASPHRAALRPVAPRMFVERVLAQRRELARQLLAASPS